MIKFLFVGRRAAGRSRKAALDHLRDVHGKLVVCPPDGAGAMPLDYAQNHVIDGAYPASGVHALERDLVTELWFDSVDHLRGSTATRYYLDTLRPDEPRFVDDATVAKMMVAARDLQVGEGSGFKLFLFAARGAIDDAGWDAACASAGAAFCALPGLAAAVENRVLAPPTGDPRFVDVVLEGRFAAREDALAAIDALDPLLAGFGPDTLELTRCFAVATEYYDRDRLRTLHGCRS